MYKFRLISKLGKLKPFTDITLRGLMIQDFENGRMLRVYRKIVYMSLIDSRYETDDYLLIRITNRNNVYKFYLERI